LLAAVADDAAPAMRAARGQRLDRALEAVGGVCRAVELDGGARLVAAVATGLTGCFRRHDLLRLPRPSGRFAGAPLRADSGGCDGDRRVRPHERRRGIVKTTSWAQALRYPTARSALRTTAA